MRDLERTIRNKYPGKVFTDPGVTQQHFKEEANINSIMRKYERTGVLVEPGVRMSRAPQFGIFENLDFHECQNKVALAKEAFMALPSRIRSRFANDPGRLLAFLGDEENRAEAIKLGLVTEVVKNQSTEVVKNQSVATETVSKEGETASA